MSTNQVLKIILPLLQLQILCNYTVTIDFTTFNPGIKLKHKERYSSYPYISGDTFRAACDFIIDETQIPFNPNEMNDGDSIFVNADFLDYFFKTVHPNINHKYILVTHNSIKTVPGKYEKFLDDPKLIAWFGKNIGIKHSKLFPLPIGLANKTWPHGNSTLADNIIKTKLPMAKNKLLYMNFAAWTNKDAREEVAQLFKNESYCTIENPKPFGQYLIDLAESKFVLSPAGAGIDCHRTWESMLMDAIPIVKTSSIDSLFEHLPIWIVNDWNEVNEKSLESKYQQLRNKTYNTERLLAQYWLDQIAEKRIDFTRNNINIDFHRCMRLSARYNRQFVEVDPFWKLVKERYNSFIADEKSYDQNKSLIPKIIHQVWLGSPLPAKYKRLRASWLAHHPDWQYKLWTEKEVDELGLTNREMYDKTTNYGEKSDIVRYEVLYRFGGLYVDTDFECLKSFERLHATCDFFAGTDDEPSVVLIGIIGARQGHPILKACIDNMKRKEKEGDTYLEILYRTGPLYFTQLLKDILPKCGNNSVVFPISYFYPWPYTHRTENRLEHIEKWIRPETFAIHHWHVAWNNGADKGNKQ